MSSDVRKALMVPSSSSEESYLPESVPNPSLEDLKDHYNSHNRNGNGSNRSKLRIPIEKR